MKWLRMLYVRAVVRWATPAEIEAQKVSDKVVADVLRGFKKITGEHCRDCKAKIIASDDDAGVCINCGGRNRRAV